MIGKVEIWDPVKCLGLKLVILKYHNMSVSLNINKCFRFGTYTPGGQTGEYNNPPEGMTFLYEPFTYSTGAPSITGYAYKVRHRTTPENLGVSVFNLDDYVTNTGSWKMETATKTLLQDLNLKYTRFYNLRSYRDWETDRKSTRLNSSHSAKSRMPSSA